MSNEKRPNLCGAVGLGRDVVKDHEMIELAGTGM